MLTSTLKTFFGKYSPYGHRLKEELHKTKTVYKGIYDFAQRGGAVGTNLILVDDDGHPVVIPDNAIITGGYIDVLTALTSTGNNGTIALQLNAANDILSAVDADTITGVAAIVPVSTAASAVKMTAERSLTLVIGTNALLTGKFNVFLEAVLSD